MEWFWQVLGIEETTNVAEVKKAFVNETRRLKNLETKEEVAQSAYERLATAETAAIAYIEDQRKPVTAPSQRPSYQEKEVETEPEKAVIQAAPQVEGGKLKALTEAAQLVKVIQLEKEGRDKQELPADPTFAREQSLVKEVQVDQAKVVDVQERLAEAKAAVKATPKETADQPVKKAVGTGERVKEAQTQVVEAVSSSPASPDGNPQNERLQPIVEPVTALPTQVLGTIRDLLADWPRKILIAEWESCFRDRHQWSRAEFNEIRTNFLPLLQLQLGYLPKAVLLYLYEELELATYELTASFNWFVAIDELPDFSFDQGVYLPEAEAADYFDRRLHLYHVLEQVDWHSRTFEIEGLFSYFYSQEGWQADYQIVDQDVENLAAIYQIKIGIEKLVHHNEPNRAIASHLLPPATDLAQVANQTAKFLRIIFTSLKTKSISLEHSLFIENPQTNYLEENLRELLVGLVFYRTNDRVKASKHFNQLTNDYRSLAKGLENAAGFKGGGQPLPPQLLREARSIDWKMIFRFIVIGLIGISLLGDACSRKEEDYYGDDETYLDSDYDDDWLAYADPGYAFLTSFVEPSEDYDDISAQRERFVDEWVSYDLVDVFEEHLDDVVSDEFYDYNIVYKQINERIEHYLITRNEEPYLIVELTDWETVTAVVGEGWQEVEEELFTELVNSLKITEKELVENLVVGYLQLAADEREEYLYEVMDLVTDEAYGRLESDVSLLEGVDFEKGSYQLSKNLSDQAALLVRDSGDQLCLILLLNDYGQVSEIVETAYDDFPQDELKYLEAHAEAKQSLPKLDAVSL